MRRTPELAPSGTMETHQETTHNNNNEKFLSFDNKNSKQTKISDFCESAVVFKQYTLDTSLENTGTKYEKAQISDTHVLKQWVDKIKNENFKISLLRQSLEDDTKSATPIEEKTITTIINLLIKNNLAMNSQIATQVNSLLTVKTPVETCYGRIGSVIANNLHVYDWILARNPNNGEQKLITTWIPMSENSYSDSIGRSWIHLADWTSWSQDSRTLFRKHNINLKLNNLTIIYKRKFQTQENPVYGLAINKLLILPQLINRLTYPNINQFKHDIYVRYQTGFTDNMAENATPETTRKQLDRYAKIKPHADELIDMVIGNCFVKANSHSKLTSDMPVRDAKFSDILNKYYEYSTSAKKPKNLTEIVQKKVIPEIHMNGLLLNTTLNRLRTMKKSTAVYYMLAFLPNARIWLRAMASEEHQHVTWHILSYKYPYNTTMDQIAFTKVDERINNKLLRLITGRNEHQICPRYFAIGKHTKNGIKIMNGMIYDIYNVKSPSQDEVRVSNQACRLFQSLYECSSQCEVKKTPQNGRSEETELNSKRAPSNLDTAIVRINNNNSNIDSPINSNQRIEVPKPPFFPLQFEPIFRPLPDIQKIVKFKRNETNVTNMTIVPILNEIQLNRYVNNNELNNNYNVVNNYMANIIVHNTPYNERQENNVPNVTLRPAIPYPNYEDEEMFDDDLHDIFEVKIINVIKRNDQSNDTHTYNDDFKIVNVKKEKVTYEQTVDFKRPLILDDNIKQDSKTTNNNQRKKNVKQLSVTQDTQTETTKQDPEISDISDISTVDQQPITNPVKPNSNPKTQKKQDTINKETIQPKMKKHVPKGNVPRYFNKSQLLNIINKIQSTSIKDPSEFILSISDEIQNDHQIPDNIIGNTSQLSETVKAKNAMKLFSKGKIGAAWKTISKNTVQGIPTMQDIDKLFPKPMKENKTTKYRFTDRRMSFRVNKDHLYTLINKSANYKSPGISKITYEHLKQLSKNNDGLDLIAKAVEQIVNSTNNVNEQIFTTSTFFLLKPNKSFRPICTQENLLKIANKIVNDITVNQAIMPQISKAQYALTGKDAQLNAADKLKHLMKAKEFKYFTALDFNNAFGSITHNAIFNALSEYGNIQNIAPYIYRYIKRVSITCEVQDEGNKDKTKEINFKLLRGIPQGDPLSMTLFVMTLDVPIRETLNKFKNEVQIIAYADDVVVATKTKEKLFEIKKYFTDRAKLIGLTINEQKTHEYSTDNITSDNIIDLNKSPMKYLGITLSLNQEEINKSAIELIDEMKSNLETLFSTNVTTQAKYHIYRTCILPKLVYVFRGTDITLEIIKERSKQISNILDKHFSLIPSHVRSMPIDMAGLGLYNIQDLYVICRIAREVQTGKSRVPPWLKSYVTKATKLIKSTLTINNNGHKIPHNDFEDENNNKNTMSDFLDTQGVTQRIVAKAFFMQRRDELLERTKKYKYKYVNIPKQILIDLLDDKQNRSINNLIASTPLSPSHTLTNEEFEMMLIMRYGITPKKYTKIECIYHKVKSNEEMQLQNSNEKNDVKKFNKDWNFWHSINCIQANIRQRNHLHNSIVGCIGSLVSQNKNIVDYKFEAFNKKEETNEENNNNNKKEHRPDILLYTANDILKIDVTVISRFTTNFKINRYHPDTGYNIKLAQYNNDPKVRPIVFDTAGRIHPESLKFLKSISANNSFLRMLQVKIIKQQTQILNSVILQNKMSEQSNNIVNFNNNRAPSDNAHNEQNTVTFKHKDNAEDIVTNVSNDNNNTQEE